MTKKKEHVKEVSVSFVRRIRLEAKVCPVCDNKFTGTKKSRYCSRACQNKAFYERHGDELRSRRVQKYHEEKQSMTRKS